MSRLVITVFAVLLFMGCSRPDGRSVEAATIGETNTFVAFSPSLKDSQKLAALLSQGTRQRINDGRAQQILDNDGLTLWTEKP